MVTSERPDPRVALVRINRPEVRNALNLATRVELAECFRNLTDDESAHCVVVAGDDRAFCGGADLHEYLAATTVDVAQRNLPQLRAAISGCPKPVIAAVNGYPLGGGCELAMLADIIVAGESARFGQPEVRVGLMPGAGATRRLTRAVGKARAMKLLLTGDMISAAEAAWSVSSCRTRRRWIARWSLPSESPTAQLWPCVKLRSWSSKA